MIFRALIVLAIACNHSAIGEDHSARKQNSRPTEDSALKRAAAAFDQKGEINRLLEAHDPESLAKALELARTQSAILEKARANGTLSTDQLRPLAAALIFTGQALESLGKLTEALALYSHALDLQNTFSESQPNHALIPQVASNELAIANGNMARVEQNLGKTANAIEHYENKKNLFLKTYSDNFLTQFQSDQHFLAWQGWEDLGSALLRAGAVDSAAHALGESAKIRERKKATRAVWKPGGYNGDLDSDVFHYLNRGRLFLAQGKLVESREAFGQLMDAIFKGSKNKNKFGGTELLDPEQLIKRLPSLANEGRTKQLGARSALLELARLSLAENDWALARQFLDALEKQGAVGEGMHREKIESACLRAQALLQQAKHSSRQSADLSLPAAQALVQESVALLNQSQVPKDSSLYVQAYETLNEIELARAETAKSPATKNQWSLSAWDHLQKGLQSRDALAESLTKAKLPYSELQKKNRSRHLAHLVHQYAALETENKLARSTDLAQSILLNHAVNVPLGSADKEDLVAAVARRLGKDGALAEIIKTYDSKTGEPTYSMLLVHSYEPDGSTGQKEFKTALLPIGNAIDVDKWPQSILAQAGSKQVSPTDIHVVKSVIGPLMQATRGRPLKQVYVSSPPELSAMNWNGVKISFDRSKQVRTLGQLPIRIHSLPNGGVSLLQGDMK